MNRRDVLVGIGAATTAAVVPSLPVLPDKVSVSIQSGVNPSVVDIVINCFKRYENEVKYFDDWLNIFEEEMETVMKSWGTYKPLEPMKFVDRDGKESIVTNMVSDPNFWNECIRGGMGTDGFHLRYRQPDGKAISVVYQNSDDKFTISIVDEEKEKIEHQRMLEAERD